MRKPYSIKLSCREASHLVSEDLDRRLGWVERIALRIHLAICDGCSKFSKQVAFLRKALQQLGSRRP